jgi:molecular chaperone GrpE
VRERLTRDVERRVGQGKADLLAPLLDVLDNILRAAGAAAQESASIGEGVGLIGLQLQSLLKQQGVEPIETVGMPYDPHVAEAVVIEPVEQERHDIVLEELQTGYRFGETILRPARVKVGKSG